MHYKCATAATLVTEALSKQAEHPGYCDIQIVQMLSFAMHNDYFVTQHITALLLLLHTYRL
jgi:hypothetical protein